MDRWAGRVALVTGASAGIGASIVRRLVAEGMRVVGAARSVDRVQVTTLAARQGTVYKILQSVTNQCYL
ncbi:Dehydrogenase/reductase SDR family member 11 [Portunus trituberculatus]|uniref:Dehydrogenase/reductase SDR family member 11 n=1 Tax=Portunus trituberculatus TaxID=210409 RepID=A0A5B7K337_PORTR|nr:Dehydrogenase/reductase SDR family member 11 [Portunus trituberculatus]